MKKQTMDCLGSLYFKVNDVEFKRIGTGKDDFGNWFHDIENLSNGKKAYNVPHNKIKSYLNLN